jgi:hypothetical protein
MYLAMNLYQSGYMEIIQRDDEWDSEKPNVVWEGNFFEITSGENSQMDDLFKKHKDVINKFNLLLQTKEKYAWVEEEAQRGQLVEIVVLVNISSGRLQDSVFKKLSQKDLSTNIQDNTNSLTVGAKAYKEKAVKEFEENHKKVFDTFNEVTF